MGSARTLHLPALLPGPFTKVHLYDRFQCMRALVLDKGSTPALTLSNDLPRPSPKEGEALIRVLLAGICSTDLELVKGYMGFSGVPGHEFVGKVEESPDKTLKGKRVVGEININCAICALCKKGLRNHCKERTVLGILGSDGAFAEYLTLPLENLHTVPDEVSDEEAVFIEPLAAALRISEQVRLSPTERVCVLGDGKLGLLTSQALSLVGCELTAVGRHGEKLAILKGRGIRTRLFDDLSERDFDVVVDCTGSPSGFNIATDLARPRGTVVLKTTVAGGADGADGVGGKSMGSPLQRDVSNRSALNKVVINELSVLGSRCGPFPRAVAALSEKSVVVTPLIEETYPLDRGIDAFTHASKKGSLKVLIRCS